MTFVPLCDTEGCERAATNNTFGGFHFCDLHINDKAGRRDKRVSLTLRLPEATWERLREQAHVERTTITALILNAIHAPGIDWRDAEVLMSGARCADAQAAPAVADRLRAMARSVELL